MKKLMVLLFIFFISSCIFSVDEGTEGWNTGTKGIVMDYEPGEPKSEYLGNQKVKVTVKYDNQGASTARNIDFWLTSYDERLLSFSNKHQEESDFQGRSEDNPDGYPSRYVKWFTDITLPSQEIDSFEQIVGVTVCYDYSTKASGLICLEPESREDSKCDFTVKDIGSSQGAPIAITEVKRQISDDEVLVELYFSNNGAGNPITGIDCLSPTVKNLDIITLKEIKIGGTRNNPRLRLPCTPTTIRLQNNKGYTVCKSKFSNKLQSAEQIYIDLNYRYRQELQDKEITITNVK